MSFPTSTGTTPATIVLQLDASTLAPGIHSGKVTISDGSAVLFTVPLTLKVEPLKVTILKSDPASAFVYGISEDTSSTAAHAYLLEVNSQTESIERVAQVGSSVSDLAIHHGDGRIYVPNWKAGSLIAVDLQSFMQVKAYSFSPFRGIGYSGGDIYRAAAGSAGRLLVEEQDQWINISIFDTTAGTILGKTFVREGGGAFDPTGRYYYHGDNNISSAQVHKYDLIGDKFFELAHSSATNTGYGSRTMVVSEDGSRVFWNGSVFNSDLSELWRIGSEVYSTSSDGRLAFGKSNIYDVNLKQIVLGMPADSTVSALNSSTSKLVVQVGNLLGFYKITDPISLQAPILSVESTPSIH